MTSYDAEICAEAFSDPNGDYPNPSRPLDFLMKSAMTAALSAPGGDLYELRSAVLAALKNLEFPSPVENTRETTEVLLEFRRRDFNLESA